MEIFFESTKKQGGGPVQNVKILRDKHVAFVEFCDRASVERVMTKRPIKLGTTVLDIEPYGSLLQGSEKINRMDVIGLPATFTDGLLKVQLDSLLSTQDPNAGYQLQSSTTLVSCTPSNVRVPNLNLGPQLQSSTPVVRGNPSNARAPNLNPGPQCRTSTPVVRRDPPTAQAPTPNPGSKPQPSTTVFRDIRAAPDPYHYDENGSTINVGSRVVRGRGWRRGNEDDGGEGTVTGIDSLLGLVKVRWDSGNIVQYNFGPYGRYVVKLAP